MKTVLIPVQLCEHVLKHKLNKPFQLYILLKSLCDGKMKIPKSEYPVLAAMLNRKSGKTINNNLKKLLALNLVGYSADSQYYFIRSLKHLQNQFNLDALTCAEFSISDIHRIQEFCLAAVAGHLVIQQKRKQWLFERKKWRSNQDSRSSSLLPYNQVTNTYLVKRLGISLQTAFSLKKKAHEAGFVEIKKHFKPLYRAVYDKWAFLKGNPELANCVRVHDKMLYLQMPDELIPKLRFKSRKKIKTYISGGIRGRI